MTWFSQVFLDQKGELRNEWRAAGFLGMYWAMALLLLFPASVLQWMLRKGATTFDLRLGVLMSCLAAMLATWACTSMERIPFRSIGFSLGRPWFRECSWGLLLGSLIILVTALSARVSGGFFWGRNPQGSILGLLSGLPFYLLVSLHEEAVYHGYPFQRMLSRLRPWPTLVIFSVLFAIRHWNNEGMMGSTLAWATLNIILAGILLGLAYLKTHSLALPIGIHLGWNWTQGSLLGFGVSGTAIAQGPWGPFFHAKPLWLTGGKFGLEASLPCAIVCSVAILLLWFWNPTPLTEEPAEN
jgi:uncharacterized protein